MNRSSPDVVQSNSQSLGGHFRPDRSADHAKKDEIFKIFPSFSGTVIFNWPKEAYEYRTPVLEDPAITSPKNFPYAATRRKKAGRISAEKAPNYLLDVAFDGLGFREGDFQFLEGLPIASVIAMIEKPEIKALLKKWPQKPGAFQSTLKMLVGQ